MDNIFVHIHFNDKIDAYGYASVEDYNDSGKPRDFLVELYPHLNAYDILRTLAHEMVHVKQYAYSEMNEQGNRWKGKRVQSLDYWSEPWEVEAHGMEPGLFTKFAVKHKLWEVFQHCQDPDMPIIPEELGWIEKEKYIEKCIDYPAWIWPNDSVDKFSKSISSFSPKKIRVGDIPNFSLYV